MKALGQQTFIIKTDSKVIQEHIEKESKARNPVLMKYLEKVREMERHFKGYSVQHIPRDDNNEADKLAKAADKNHAMPPNVFFEIIKEPSIQESKLKIVNIVETRDWRAEIMAYLRGHYEPRDELEEKRLKQRARGYAVVNGELYKSGVTEPWLRCITSEKVVEILKKIHSGCCGAHIGTRALAGKTIKQGFYLPSINVDAKKLVRECEACQKIVNQQNLPSMSVHLIPPSWPLQRWGMDLVGPLPTAQGNCKFATVAVDYFTKWVEAKALANITTPTIQKFFWQNIICRFGVPRELTVDNGKQFDSYSFKEYCKTLSTHAKFLSVYHPQSNGAVERANGLIFSSIKKCLYDQKKVKWTDELPKVIWSRNTTVSRATGFTPFCLLLGTEAMTPEEIKNESMGVQKAKEIEEVDIKVEKDMIDLTILEAAENIEKYQKETKAWKDRKLVRKDIKTGDLVLKRKKNWENPGKLQEPWEGSFIAKETSMPGAFRLLDQTGEELPHSWNADSLKRYYP
jgi:transposase InsO family protein